MTCHLKITRTVQLPDKLRLARFARAPELGPEILFFSGGSALNPLSRCLTDYTHNSIHIITPFDSGGSSAKLRQAFKMPAVGDLRNRLMALSDQTIRGNPDIGRLFSHRLPKDLSRTKLLELLQDMVDGHHPLISAVIDPMRKIIRNHLYFFQKEMPSNFDLRGASIGNLVITGGYLNYERHMDPVLFLFSKLAEVRGVVRPVVNLDLHLVTELENGRVLVGQHLLTGKEVEPIESPVRRVFLSADNQNPRPIHPPIREKIRRLIERAELICYPIGSFYSSVIANLLPRGVAQTIAGTDCPKVYIPNVGRDPECINHSLTHWAETLITCLKEQAPEARTDQLLQFIVIDSKKARYDLPTDIKALEDLGLTVIDTDLASDEHPERLDPLRLVEVLLSLV
jgi:CofD-related protein of GAK system